MKGDLLLRGFLWELGAFLLLGAMARAAEPRVEAFGHVEWRAVFQGVEHTSVVLTEPRPMRAQVLRVR